MVCSPSFPIGQCNSCSERWDGFMTDQEIRVVVPRSMQCKEIQNGKRPENPETVVDKRRIISCG